MVALTGNPVSDPNPFGATNEHEVIAFESSAGLRLPVQYRNYLIKYNGGVFTNCLFDRENGANGRIHHMFGLHHGASYSNLYKNWQLSEYYDIGENAAGVSNYLVFADTGTGDLLLIGINDGKIYFLDHETIEYDEDWEASSINPLLLSDTFDSFVDSLLPD